MPFRQQTYQLCYDSSHPSSPSLWKIGSLFILAFEEQRWFKTSSQHEKKGEVLTMIDSQLANYLGSDCEAL